MQGYNVCFDMHIQRTQWLHTVFKNEKKKTVHNLLIDSIKTKFKFDFYHLELKTFIFLENKWKNKFI